ncbi:MAG: FeoA family protein [Bacilli bacterium]|jgi:ferrous iron transport protein A|nr:FeoA family protein [Bacilli bacterium]HHU24378.1 ferrous iron transport protein A [Acholeplasmataceae bacterium]
MFFNKNKKTNRLKVGEEGHLSDLQLNQKAVVLALHNDNPALRRRLLDMGITKGVVLQIKKIAPMGDPVDIELRGYELCLRREDMRQIDIKVLEDENSISRQSK